VISPLLPRELLASWDDVAKSALERSQAKIVLTFGQASIGAYEQFAKETGRTPHDCWIGQQRPNVQPDAWLEYEDTKHARERASAA
jgi:hypothetical protein